MTSPNASSPTGTTDGDAQTRRSAIGGDIAGPAGAPAQGTKKAGWGPLSSGLRDISSRCRYIHGQRGSIGSNSAFCFKSLTAHLAGRSCLHRLMTDTWETIVFELSPRPKKTDRPRTKCASGRTCPVQAVASWIADSFQSPPFLRTKVQSSTVSVGSSTPLTSAPVARSRRTSIDS